MRWLLIAVLVAGEIVLLVSGVAVLVLQTGDSTNGYTCTYVHALGIHSRGSTEQKAPCAWTIPMKPW